MPRPFRTLHSLYIKQSESQGGCWVWMGIIDSKCYGKYQLIKNCKSVIQAHRAVYQDLVGPIPNNLQLDHKCRNHRCVNPDHLEIVTNATNVRRASDTKLTLEIARQIRDGALKGETQRQIASRYKISQRLVWSILHNEVWQEGKELNTLKEMSNA